MIRLLLADDHAVLRAGMRRLLSDVPDLCLALEVGSAFDAIEAVREQQIDVAVIDVSMPGPGVCATIESICAASPNTRVVVLSAHPVDQYAVRALRAGASAYLMKSEPWTDLVAAIRKVHAGGKYVTPAVAEALAASVGTSSSSRPELSEREIQVLQRMAAGLAAADIASQLNVSPKTVHTYRGRLLEKLGLKTNADLIRYALENHWIE